MDKNMLAGLEGLPEEDKARMSSMIDHLQLRDRCVSRSFFPSNFPFFPLQIRLLTSLFASWIGYVMKF